MVSVRRLLGIVAIAGAGITGALAAHSALFAIESTGLLGDGYLKHAHTSLPTVMLTAAAVLCGLSALYLADALDQERRRALIECARSFGGLDPLMIVAAVALSATGCLTLMEGSEGSLALTFGSNPLIGLAIVTLIGALFGFGLRAIARWIAGATEYLAAAIASVLLEIVDSARRCYERRCFAAVCIARNAALRTDGPDRAPPFFLA